MQEDNLKKLEDDLANLKTEVQSEPLNPLSTPSSPSLPIMPTETHEIPQEKSFLSKLATFLIFIAAISLTGYFLGTKYLTPKPTAVFTTAPTPIVSPEPATKAEDPTANWKTYTNDKYKFSFKYPGVWKDITEDRVVEGGNNEFRIQTNSGEFVTGIIFNGEADVLKDQPWRKEIALKSGKYLLITYVDNLGPGSKGGATEIETFDQILYTFKFLEVSPTPSATGY